MNLALYSLRETEREREREREGGRRKGGGNMDIVKQTAVSYLITPVVENIMPYLPNFWSGRKELEKLKRLPRENKRMIDRCIREIARERRSLQNQDKKLILEMKKSAKKGQMRAIKVMAKDLIRKRHQMKRSYALKSQLHGVALQIQVISQFSVLIYLIAQKVNASNSFHL
eukprot:TRINITY_DN13406_c0_g1_i2.p1 TRINITY_DN13406_c0_g1~~TRINITY_DN13406_c0_g1_i2.p1  ORF type:complete len:171 (-),score=35.75 TRINITY_DN13406_c0_g1_i2:24-536(-)